MRRSERRFGNADYHRFFARKRVLVTGAAGSIGSALALKLAQLGCAQLQLLDHADHALLDIYERIRREAPGQAVTDILCDVRDRDRLHAVMRRAAPDIVLHAAALKHVHLGERHPIECLLTNLIGVRNCLSAAADAGAKQFLLVSSDKAAAPVCAMGASKRLAELHLAGFAVDRPDASIALKCVRFGNVLGTQGSVLPRFAARIEAGEDIEITHKDMERFFMTEGEAVDLILSVSAQPQDDAVGVYVMEMGDPVSILDIGRELIRRSGKPIGIVYTGLRPGERLKEQLSDEFERVSDSALPGVYCVRAKAADAFVTGADVAHLETLARSLDDAIVRQRLFAYLDERLGRRLRATG
jgi:FlaA1/EpsC-like NDP-sugar epimerase